MAKKTDTTTKFSQEELDGLQAVRTDYLNIQNEFGSLRVRKLQLEQQLEAIDNREVELESEVSGEVMEILVENGTPVEFGQVLMRLKPV